MTEKNTDAELLRDIEEHMRNMWDARLLPAACWPTELAQRLTQAVHRTPAAPVPQGWKLVPDDANMTDEQAEAICAVAKVCGGGAYDIYRAALAAAPKPPETEENPLQEQLDEALQSLEFYKRRCDLLQSIQPRMRDPERTMVCDVLANGHLLQGGDGQPDKARYAPPEAVPVRKPLTDARCIEILKFGQSSVAMVRAVERAHGIK